MGHYGIHHSGCVLSSWFSCSSFHAWFTAGACVTPRDHRAAVISLYYAYTVDIITDLAIMALPLCLIWNLKMQVKQKLSIGGLFCFGWICIIISTIRVIQLGETANAVIIGCCPGLYRIVKTAIPASKNSYTYESYGMRGDEGSGIPSHRSVGLRETHIAINSFTGKVEAYQSTSAYRCSSSASSQEKLAHPSDRCNIMVSYGVAITVEDRSSDYDRPTRFV
ncbi:uncharacterized protein N7498_007138 [Penicillium cinerascens]|uniref:Rhodopsin domain-containing protein n=1 Tax=Penicillium cinerascens TaxID=70096 RepID=A0A9W9JL05_9EURO|nr:uncharacterized protein N7498_007138 [Penicillium cinerascens]KAJ5198021.1 hypothetical protein N7498_007138 [Penicillium cinerascens]